MRQKDIANLKCPHCHEQLEIEITTSDVTTPDGELLGVAVALEIQNPHKETPLTGKLNVPLADILKGLGDSPDRYSEDNRYDALADLVLKISAKQMDQAMRMSMLLPIAQEMKKEVKNFIKRTDDLNRRLSIIESDDVDKAFDEGAKLRTIEGRLRDLELRLATVSETGHAVDSATPSADGPIPGERQTPTINGGF